ncbi:hypothetical protein DFJ73DRAFT_392927 [Zopfochytrium polystomum]|nr:hypothetical protein DFJ73DRAFT_392927 [Zopfochytrium polystomum]
MKFGGDSISDHSRRHKRFLSRTDMAASPGSSAPVTSQFLADFAGAVASTDGRLLAALLSASVDPVLLAAAAGEIAALGPARLARALDGWQLPDRYKPVIQRYWAYLSAGDDGLQKAYGAVLSAFMPAFTSVWQISAFRSMCSGLVAIAVEAENYQKAAGLKPDKLVEALNDLSRLCALASSERAEIGQRLGFLVLTNCCFKICFKVQSLLSSGLTYLEFPLCDAVTYHYYLGRLRILQHDFDAADASLSFSWKYCPQVYERQRRKILIYLTVARIIRGRFPTQELLAKYSLDAVFGDLIDPLKAGDFAGYKRALDYRAEWLRRHGCLSIMTHRVKILMFRGVFRATFLATGGGKMCSFEILASACRFAGWDDFTVEDAECIAQSLIDQGLIKGYISHGRKVLVFGRNVSPFPQMYIAPIAIETT